MNAFINSIYAALGANWIAIVIMAIAVTIVMGIIGFFVDRVTKPSKTKAIIMTAAMCIIWTVMFTAIGKPNVAGALIGLQTTVLLSQLAALKAYAQWQAMSNECNPGAAAA